MQEEGMQNAISLGLFTVEANAESRVRELAAKKIQARIQPFQQTRTRFWLDVAVRAPAETQGKLKQIDWAAKDVQVREITCRPAPARRRPNRPRRATTRRAEWAAPPRAVILAVLFSLYARIAQLVEHLICNQDVGGSRPSAGSIHAIPGDASVAVRSPGRAILGAAFAGANAR
jgi:hypothetical protein